MYPPEAIVVSRAPSWDNVWKCDSYDSKHRGRDDKDRGGKSTSDCHWEMQYAPPRDEVVDPQSSARLASEEACMYRRGYEKK
jgi:hypothetical protein